MLSARYRLLHCAGAALCLASLALYVVADSRSSQASNVVLGDGLVIMGAMLYAACNVTQEKLLRAPSCPSLDAGTAHSPEDEGYRHGALCVLGGICGSA